MLKKQVLKKSNLRAVWDWLSILLLIRFLIYVRQSFSLQLLASDFFSFIFLFFYVFRIKFPNNIDNVHKSLGQNFKIWNPHWSIIDNLIWKFSHFRVPKSNNLTLFSIVKSNNKKINIIFSRMFLINVLPSSFRLLIGNEFCGVWTCFDK